MKTSLLKKVLSFLILLQVCTFCFAQTGLPPCLPSTPAPELASCPGDKIWQCRFVCCTSEWACKCVKPNSTNNYFNWFGTLIDPSPCHGGNGNGNAHGNGNNVAVSEFNSDRYTEKEQTINPVLGDVSFVEKYGYQPDANTDEQLRIITHFEFVENLLRQKDVSCLSPTLQQKREHLIDLFHKYKVDGKFPRNYDYDDQRRPCFIDKDNTICAVGYLVEQTSGRKAAEDINARFKYDDLLDMDDALVDNWVAQSGLTKEEVAMIQPTYGPYYPICHGNKIYACRMNNCIWECKCVNANQVDEWQAKGKPCDTDVPGSAFNDHGVPGSPEILIPQIPVVDVSETLLVFPRTDSNGLIVPEPAETKLK